MRPKPAWAFLALSIAAVGAWISLPVAVHSQDAAETDERGEATRLVSSLELGVPFDLDAQEQFENQLTFDERARLIKLQPRYAIASPDCPLPTSEPLQPFYVRFHEPLGRAFADRLAGAGASFIGYAYPNTHFIRAKDADSLRAIGDLLQTEPNVAGTLLQLPVDKCSVEAWADINDPANNGGAYRLLFWRDRAAEQAAVLLAGLNAVIQQAEFDETGKLSLETPFVDVLVDRAGLLALGRSEMVEWIERTPQLVSYNAASTLLHTARANDIGPGTSYNLDGTGMVAAVWDEFRARDTHQALQGAPSPSPINNGSKRVIKVDGTSLGNHGTHVTGTMIGDGTGNSSARGYAPEACVASHDWNSMDTERRAARYNYRHVADNHSYGTGSSYGGYDSAAQSSDIDIRDIFLNMCKSAGNSGSSSNTVSADSCMKNSFTIASVSDSGVISSFSSRGPTADGRLIPHFSANGEELTSTYATSDTAYASASGTSMASPSATGALILLAQLWQREMNNRQFAPDVARGVLAATVTDAYNQGPDYRYGFGVIKTKRAADLILANKASNEQNIVRAQIRQGETLEWDLQVSSSATPLKVVCSWLDIYASTSSSIKLINDLDLTLVSPTGATFYPWSGLTSGSTGNQTYQWTRTGHNRRDNIELAEVDSPAVGTWKVRVNGYNIPANPQSSVPNSVMGFVLVSERPMVAPKIVVEDSLNTGSPVSIPDNNTTGVTRSFSVSGTGTVQQVRLHVDVKHQRRADVRIRLRHPDGTEAVVNNTGSSPRTDLIAVYPDTRQYADDVIALYGKPVAGTWQVIVSDHASGNTGSIRYLALEIDSNAGGSGNYPPNADAGLDQTVNEGATVNLNGSASSDPDGDTLSYQWVRLSGPAVTIVNSNTATPYFTAPQVSSTQVVVIQLTVDDGNGNQDTDTVSITVNDVPAPNNPPTASAGVDFSVTEGNVGTLNGTGSSDPDGDTLSYAWIELGSSWVTIQNAGSAQATFTAPMVTTPLAITFQLTVDDGRGGSDTDTVVVTVLDSAVNNPPNADAGPDAYTAYAAVTQLDGSGSSDPENDTLSFSWAQIGGTSTVTLTGANTATPSFTAPDVDDVLVFQLTVNDGNGNSDTDTVTVVVNATGTVPTGGGGTGSSGGGGDKDGGCSTGRDTSRLLLLLLALVTGTLVSRRFRRE